MWYVIIGRDAPDSLDLRLRERPAHLARLHALQDEARLLLAGPMPAIDCEDPGSAGYVGSVIVAAFEDLDAAKAWAEDDPYRRSGVYAEVEVQPFRRVLP